MISPPELGFPQSRQRLFIVGRHMRKLGEKALGQYPFPEPTHPPSADALNSLLLADAEAQRLEPQCCRPLTACASEKLRIITHKTQGARRNLVAGRSIQSKSSHFGAVNQARFKTLFAMPHHPMQRVLPSRERPIHHVDRSIANPRLSRWRLEPSGSRKHTCESEVQACRQFNAC